MDDADLNTPELLRQHGVEKVREVHTYVGHVESLGPVTFRVEDGGIAGDHRWLVEVQDSLGQQLAGHEADRLPLALAGVFDTLKMRQA
jgi:hypothetical protein